MHRRVHVNEVIPHKGKIVISATASDLDNVHLQVTDFGKNNTIFAISTEESFKSVYVSSGNKLRLIYDNAKFPMTGNFIIQPNGKFELHSKSGFNITINYLGEKYRICSKAATRLTPNSLDKLITMSGSIEGLDDKSKQDLALINHNLLKNFLAQNKFHDYEENAREQLAQTYVQKQLAILGNQSYVSLRILGEVGQAEVDPSESGSDCDSDSSYEEL